MKRANGYWVVALLLAALFLVACGDDSSSGDTTEDCKQCVDTECTAQLTACEADDACKSIMDCMDTCAAAEGDMSSCYGTCVSQSPAGASLFEAMAGCAENNCSACSEGDDDTDGDEKTVEDCQECVNSECPSEISACEANTACEEILDCLGSCLSEEGDDSPSCSQTCIEQNPDGETLFQAVSSCAAANCDICT